ncbi:hypothetical protein [Streptomyces justiciae]|uniref:hypothetical protein n=1 Tax=Streptomyces justiciae TaxID=2780140 RepID=UPI0018818A41|nr:hypothetical protein [Streptomyces justiciae]MBE8478036.1 hypothetical protein [Streptomyces justiciae]MCW8383720.1 hypothetical protein [Streptomyces justiciae]
MYVLVPDDPVFYAKFQSLEEPLLRHLYRLHHTGAEPDDERIIADAYDSWVQVLLKLPLWARWHTEDVPAVTAPAEPPPPRYTLHTMRGDQLTSLYPIEVTAVDLGQLTACLDLLAALGERPGARAGSGLPDDEKRLTDVFRRVVDVLLLPPPPRLLNILRFVTQGVAVSVTLPTEREQEYQRFCAEIVTILSSGDTFAYQSHRAMYL